VPVNDDTGLEKEADVMGAKALQMRHADKVGVGPLAGTTTHLLTGSARQITIQRWPPFRWPPWGKSKGYEKLDDETAPIKEKMKEHRGPLVEAKLSPFEEYSMKIGEAGNVVTSLGTSLAVDKLVGQNLKEGLPISFKRHVLINVGQILTLASDIVGFIPVVGEAAAGLSGLTYAGTALEAKGRGMSTKQATALATHTTSMAMATGAIPFAGTAFSAVGTANDLRNFCTPVPKAGKKEAIGQMRATRDKAKELLGEINLLHDELVQADQVEAARKVMTKRDEIAKRIDNLDYYIEKYDSIILTKLERDKTPLLKYADYVPESVASFRALLDTE
jgi:hypothetical protein